MINLTDAEWKLMNVLWETDGAGITQLVALLKSETAWSKHTVITMLTRLAAKGAVDYTQNKRAKRFYAIINRENAQLEETKSFLSKLYDGSLGLMLNTMVDSNELSKNEIDELYNILKNAEAKHHD